LDINVTHAKANNCFAKRRLTKKWDEWFDSPKPFVRIVQPRR